MGFEDLQSVLDDLYDLPDIQLITTEQVEIIGFNSFILNAFSKSIRFVYCRSCNFTVTALVNRGTESEGKWGSPVKQEIYIMMSGLT